MTLMEMKSPVIPEFLSGGGEMGERMRSFDWSTTPLGPVDRWPQSLKTCVRIILTSRQPMFVWWGEQLINLYNDAYKTIVGGKHPEALGQPASVVWHEIWNQIGPRAELVMRQNEGTYDEALLLIMERNGYPEETYYTFSYSPVPGDQGGTSGIICANTDDTERIIVERQLRTLKDLGRHLINSKAIDDVYKRTIDVLKENPQDFPFAFLYQIEQEGTIARLVGNTTSHVPDKVAEPVVDLRAPGDIPQLLASVVQSNKLAVAENLIARFGQLPSGAWMQSPDKALNLPISQSSHHFPYALLKVGLNPYRLLDEKYISFFQLVADQIATGIAHARAYEEERRRTEALVELDRAKTTFFSNISHEFRTPLTLMLGPLEELLNQTDSPLTPPQQTRIESTHRNAMRLLRLVNTLLDFSRIEAGRVQGQFQPIDLAGFTTDLAGSFRSAIEHVGLAFEVDCRKLSQPVYVDQEMWEKIILNLLSNAFKYTLQGKISITLRQEQNQAVLRVADTGVGIPAEELPRMFERFHRVKNVTGRTHEGTGIGLSLVNELVKLHHGHISVSSTVNEGSVFTIAIPVGKDHLPPAQVSDTIQAPYKPGQTDLYIKEAITLSGDSIQQQSARTVTESLHPSSENDYTASAKTRVLVVDDNRDMRAYIQRLLEKYYTVETAEDGQIALDMIRRYPPDLIVSDIMMPVMDGIELLNTLKSQPATVNIPVILLSARAGEEARIEGFDIGADDYLVKPFSANELLARIRSQIRINQTRRQTEMHLRSLFMQAPMGIGIYRGPDYVIELANEIMVTYWGRTTREVLNKPLFEVLPEFQTQGFKAIFDAVYATGVPYVSNEIPATLLRNGKLETSYNKIVLAPLREEDGRISGIMGMANDITEMVIARRTAQLNAEELEKKVIERTGELLHKNSELRQQKEFVETIIDSSAHVLVVLDKDMRFTAVNKKCEQLYRVPREELIGKTYLEAFPQARGSKAHHDIEAALAGHANHNNVTYSAVINGYFENFFIPLTNENEVYGVLILLHDITDLVVATQKLEQANKELTRTNHELEQFAYIASHDLQEPLRKIQTFSELLQYNITNEAIVQNYLNKITSSAQRMAALIKAVLNYSRLTKDDEQYKSIDLNTIIKDVLTDFELLIEQKNAVINHSDLPVIRGIPLQLNQLFSNLISNSLKFSEQNPLIQIWSETLNQDAVSALSRLNPDKNYLKIVFKDNGIGFGQQYAEQIFTIFHRLHERNAYSGTGIGLALCKKIVENHKGIIQAESAPGEGATFIIYLPVTT